MNNNELVGFVNWAYIHDIVEKRFKQTGKIKSNEWKSGNNLWLIEIVSIKNTFKMMRWVYHYFRKQLKVDHSINWLRVDSDIYRVGQKFKRSYH
jgi:hemolysin-activating ACP:hemolysin acyltransferase